MKKADFWQRTILTIKECLLPSGLFHFQILSAPLPWDNGGTRYFWRPPTNTIWFLQPLLLNFNFFMSLIVLDHHQTAFQSSVIPPKYALKSTQSLIVTLESWIALIHFKVKISSELHSQYIAMFNARVNFMNSGVKISSRFQKSYGSS